MSAPTDTHTVAIAGAGPKGLQCLERLLAELACRPSRPSIHIYLFSIGGKPGTSRVYHPDLPPYLLVNNMHHEEIVATAATPERPCVTHLPTLAQWSASCGIPASASISRAQVGSFLAECGRLLVAAAPRGVKIQLHDSELIDVFTNQLELRLRARRADGTEYELSCDQLLLSTGHGAWDRSTMVDSATVSSHGVVGICGMGLGALDTILVLTQGRGGRFEHADTGRLQYRRSGNEPDRIVPFCRTGVPILPSHQRHDTTDRQLQVFTLERLESMAHRLQRRLSWHRDVQPLILREFRSQFRATIAQCAMWASVAQRRPPFDAKLLLRPHLLNQACDDFEYANSIRRCIELLLGPEIRDTHLHAYRSAVSTWYEISGVLDALCRQELLDADSHVALLNEISPMMRRIAFGANHVSMTKLLALVRAGIVDFSMIRSVARKAPVSAGAAMLRSANGRTLRLDGVIDAFVPTFDTREDCGDLYKTLLERGTIRPHALPGAKSTSGVTGAIDVTIDEQWAITKTGDFDERLSVTGIPTQGRLLNTWTIAPDCFPAQWAKRVCDRMLAEPTLVPSLQT